jgi:hypothetical protein
MTEKERSVSVEEATHEVEIAITRLALLHLSFLKPSLKSLARRKAKS